MGQSIKFWLALLQRRVTQHGNRLVIEAEARGRREAARRAYRIALKHSPKAAQAIAREIEQEGGEWGHV